MGCEFQIHLISHLHTLTTCISYVEDETYSLLIKWCRNSHQEQGVSFHLAVEADCALEMILPSLKFPSSFTIFFWTTSELY